MGVFETPPFDAGTHGRGAGHGRGDGEGRHDDRRRRRLRGGGRGGRARVADEPRLDGRRRVARVSRGQDAARASPRSTTDGPDDEAPDLRRKLEDEPRARRGPRVPARVPRALTRSADDRTVMFFPPALTFGRGARGARGPARHPARRAEHPLGGQGRVHRRELGAASRATPARRTRSSATRSAGTSSARPTRQTAQEVRGRRSRRPHAGALRRRDARRSASAARPSRSCCGSCAPGSAASTPAQVGLDRDRVRAGLGDRHRARPPRRPTRPPCTRDPRASSGARRAHVGSVPILYGGSVKPRQRRGAAGAAGGGRGARRRRQPRRRQLAGDRRERLRPRSLGALDAGS